MASQKESYETLLGSNNRLPETGRASFPPIHMTTDMSAPATKQDFFLFAQEMRSYFTGLRGEFNDLRTEVTDLRAEVANLRAEVADFRTEFLDFKAEVLNRFARTDERQYSFEAKIDELRLHFDFTVETIRHDLQSANREEILNIKDRVGRLERQPRFRSAA